MKHFAVTITCCLCSLFTVVAQPYWPSLSDSEQSFLSHSGKVSALARGYFQDPSLTLKDSLTAMQLITEIGQCDKQHLPLYWQLFAQTDWPPSIDSTVAASHLSNLLERYPDFIIGYFATQADRKTNDRYIALLAHGYSATPWLYPNTKVLKKRLKKQVDAQHRKAIKLFIKQLTAAF